MSDKPEVCEIKNAVKEAFDEKMKDFYVEREQHYQDHLFLKDLRDWFTSIRNTMLKTIVGIVITAVFVIMLIGFISWGKANFK